MSIDYRYPLSPREQQAYDAVTDGDPEAVTDFATHLVEEGLLGASIADIDINLTVGHMVERYIQTKDGVAELKAWAIAVVDERGMEEAA
ncbi:hypothetical protein [Halomonas caseinilytica]|uniref:hypothetical protein n=1 Tax=Halomonas caseinilytica TaxID=438744 RepID=UPI0007E545D0|nr:hypothetical protein [Halomonas caseinilytica]